MTQEGKDLKESYGWQIKTQWKGGILKGKVGVDLFLYFSDEKRRDVDNFTKLVIDSLKGMCFEDDSQIYDLHIKKVVDKFFPRIEVNIRTI
jgi:Holliday junction resolvase RusA-like endonuclease